LEQSTVYGRVKIFLQDVNAKKETKKGKNISRNITIPFITLHEKSTKGALFLSLVWVNASTY